MKEFSINLGIPSVPITTNEELFRELVPVYNALRNILSVVDGFTGAVVPPVDYWSELGVQVRNNGLMKVYVPAFEAINPGQTIAFHDDAGTTKARLSVEPTYRTRGFCSNDAAVAIGEMVEVTLAGQFNYFTPGSLTVNATYYAGVTPGTISVGGTQRVGFAINKDILYFSPEL